VLGEAPVTLSGRNFFGVTGVTIGGQPATFTLTDGTSLSATVAATAATGNAPLSVVNAQGTGTSAKGMRNSSACTVSSVSISKPSDTAGNDFA